MQVSPIHVDEDGLADLFRTGTNRDMPPVLIRLQEQGRRSAMASPMLIEEAEKT